MRLGTTLTIPAKAELQEAAKETKYHTKHYIHTIAIGKDHTASFIIDEEALKELQKQEGLIRD